MLYYVVQHCKSTHGKVVDHHAPRGNVALSDMRGPIRLIGTILIEAMPMNTGGFIAQAVVDFCDDPVSACEVQHGERPLSIDPYNRTLHHPIGICCRPGDVPVVVERCSHSRNDVGKDARE